MSHKLLNYAFLLFWSIFVGNSQKSKKWISQKRALKYLESLFFLPCLKGANPEEFFLFKQLFFITPVKGDNYLQNLFFSPKWPLLNYAFVMFSSIFGEIHRELLFLVKKVTIIEMRTEIIWNIFFLPCLLRGEILRKIWICLNQYLWLNQLKGININKNCFSSQYEPYTTKLCLSVVLKHFRENL